MRVFLAYSSTDRAVAERVDLALKGAGHTVFFDRTSLPPGETFDLRILTALEESDLIVFLISPDSIASGAYTLTELEGARQRWPTPAGHVLPVVVRPVDPEAVPAYLRAVTFLEPEGDVAAETIAAIEKLRYRSRRTKRAAVYLLVLLGLIGGGLGIAYVLSRRWECRLAAAKLETTAARILDFANGAGRREAELSDAAQKARWSPYDARTAESMHARSRAEAETHFAWQRAIRDHDAEMKQLFTEVRARVSGYVTACRKPEVVLEEPFGFEGERIEAFRALAERLRALINES